MNAHDGNHGTDRANRKTSIERPRGRPADTKSGEFQTSLLNSAESLFSENGYAATSVRSVADRAGVNPALVHYYFGTKHDLLMAVIDRALQPMADGISAIRASGSSRLEDFAELFFNMAAEHPAMPKLITREVLLSSGETKDIFARDYAPKIGGALPALLSKEQKDGRINAAYDPGAASLMLLSLCIFPFIARSLAEPILGIDFGSDGTKTIKRHVVNVLQRGMTT